jgi:SET domain
VDASRTASPRAPAHTIKDLEAYDEGLAGNADLTNPLQRNVYMSAMGAFVACKEISAGDQIVRDAVDIRLYVKLSEHGATAFVKVQLGVFAAARIPPGTVLGIYEGKLLPVGERRSVYGLARNVDGVDWYVSASNAARGNVLRYCNHSDAPNVWWSVHGIFYTMRTIEKDEEVTISYLMYKPDGTSAKKMDIADWEKGEHPDADD